MSYYYKGYCLPKDLLLLLDIFLFCSYYSVMICFFPIRDILDKTRALKLKRKYCWQGNTLEELNKVWRGCNWFLLRVMNTSRPCLRRSLVIYRWCCLRNIDACVSIGVRKNGKKLDGHSWVVVNGVPYNEPNSDLEQYSCILKG